MLDTHQGAADYMIVGWILLGLPILIWLLQSLTIGDRPRKIRDPRPLISSANVGAIFVIIAYIGWESVFTFLFFLLFLTV